MPSIDTSRLPEAALLHQKNLFVPELPVAVDTVFYATQGGPFNIRQLASKVELDKALQQEIIKICSNNYYSGRTPITSINQAIRRLGPIGFQGVVMQSFLDMEIYHNPQWSKVTASLRRYANAVAHACRVIAQQISIQTDLAFLMGLLHRIGMSVALLRLKNNKENPIETIHRLKIIAYVHSFLSHFILKKWEMPSPLVEAMGYYGQVLIHGKPNHLGAILIVAEEIVSRIGFSSKNLFHNKDINTTSLSDGFEDACLVLGIPKDQLYPLQKETQEALRSSSKML